MVGRGVDFGEDIKVETGTPLSAVWCGGGDEGWLPGVGVKDEERNQLEKQLGTKTGLPRRLKRKRQEEESGRVRGVPGSGGRLGG